MWHGVKSFFHILIVFQSLIFVVYLFSHKDVRKLSKLVLISFLIVIAITEIGGFFNHFLELKTLIIREAPFLLYVDLPFNFVYTPLLYFYVISLTNKDFSFKKQYWAHFVPFIISIVYITAKFYTLELNQARELIAGNDFISRAEHNFLEFIEHFQFFCYAILSLVVIKNYRINIKNAFSSVKKINLSWLNFVIWGLITWKFIRFMDYLLWLTMDNISINILYIMYISAEITFLIFITLLFLKGLKQPLVFFGIIEETVKGKYKKNGLPDFKKKLYEKKIKQYMEDEKPYLDSLLNIKGLATMLSMPTHHLSHVINSNINQKFFDFINSYRIEESKRLLEQYNPREKTILEILYESGFNSKSVYNTAFKKHTGLTPTQYREKSSSKTP